MILDGRKSDDEADPAPLNVHSKTPLAASTKQVRFNSLGSNSEPQIGRVAANATQQQTMNKVVLMD